MNKNIIITFLLLIITVLLYKSCNGADTIIKTETQIEVHTDTIIKILTDTIRETKYILNERVKYVYGDTITFNEQTFRDTNYLLKTYSKDIVDSIYLEIDNKQTYIRDSIIITNTNNIYKNYERGLGINYIYNMENNISLMYIHNFNRISLNGQIGIGLNSKQPFIGGGIIYNFN